MNETNGFSYEIVSEWYSLILSYDSEMYPTPDDAAYLVMEAGGKGVEIREDGTLQLFIEIHKSSTIGAVENVLDTIPGIQIVERCEVDTSDWTEKCQEVWETVCIGELTIQPVASQAHLPTPHSPKTIFITPGTGFGTGHHPCTQFALKLLQHPEIQFAPPRNVLDVGTGSGILAIAAHSLYRSDVTAIDNDPLALVNAQLNISRHQMEQNISLLEGEVRDLDGRVYNLILANIYAEVLAGLAGSFRRGTTAGSFVVLAGIMNSRRDIVLDAFLGSPLRELSDEPSVRQPTEPVVECAWQLVEEIGDESWSAFLLKRKYESNLL